MNVVLLSGDLMFTPRLEAACRRHGAELLAVRDVESLCQIAEASAAILDLSTPGIRPAEVVASLRSRGVAAFAAYAAHVQHLILQEARAAGCHLVLTRGQLHAQCEQVVAQLLKLCAPGS
ncbi:MAG: hypothetical protein K6T86_06785 [Pirellulales bacterium]|nr:hypothetical protein [Pirellulales bacterium]